MKFGRQIRRHANRAWEPLDLVAVAVHEVDGRLTVDEDVPGIDVSQEHVQRVQVPDGVEDRQRQSDQVSPIPVGKALQKERLDEDGSLELTPFGARHEVPDRFPRSVVGKRDRPTDRGVSPLTRCHQLQLLYNELLKSTPMVDLTHKAAVCGVGNALPASAERAEKTHGTAVGVADSLAFTWDLGSVDHRVGQTRGTLALREWLNLREVADTRGSPPPSRSRYRWEAIATGWKSVLDAAIVARVEGPPHWVAMFPDTVGVDAVNPVDGCAFV